MNTAQRIARNTLSLFTSGLVAPVVAMIGVIYLARVLGPGDFGAVNFAIALTAYFTIFAEVGLGLYGTRELARDKCGVRNLMGNVISLRIALSILSFIALLVFAFFLNKPHDIKLLIVIFGLGLLPSAFIIEWAYQGVEQMQYMGLARILTKVLFTVLVVVFVKRHEQLVLVPWFQLCGVLVVTAIFYYVFVKKYGAPILRIDLKAWKVMLKAALPLGVSVILIQVVWNISTVMLGFMKGEEEVGYFNAAYKLVLPVVLGVAAYADAIFPVLSNYYKTSLEKLEKVQEYTARIMVSVAVPCAIGGIIIARPVIDLVFGETYGRSIIAFQILICSAAVICLNIIYARGLWACNRQNVYLKIVFVQALANVIINFILIPKYGLMGAAIGNLAAESLGLVFYYREFNKITPIRLSPYFARPLLAAAIMAIFMLCARQMHVIIVIVGAMVIYGTFLFITKGITRNDLAMVRGSIS